MTIDACLHHSEAALDLLVNLPHPYDSFRGGWIFEYQFEEALRGHPMKSKHWRFRSAHKIDEEWDRMRIGIENFIKEERQLQFARTLDC